MKQYKLTYPVNLSNPSGGACTSPLAIITQMEAAQKTALQKIDGFLKTGDNAQKCAAVTPVKGQIAILITCTPELLRDLARLPGIGVLGECKPAPPAPKPFSFKPRP